MRLKIIREFIRQFDWLLLACLLLLISIGLMILYSVALGREGGDLALVRKQLAVAAVGVALFLVMSFIDFRTWRAASPALYVVMLLILGAVLVIGRTVNATRGWLEAGGWRVQPAELAKLVAVITLSAYFASRARHLNYFRYLGQSFALMAVMAGLVLMQPDFGSGVLFVFWWLMMLLTIGVKRRYVVGLLMVLCTLGVVGWLFFFKPYQKDRIVVFLFPTERAAAQTYNIRQAIIAVGAGGLTGRGLGQGSQSQLRFLPEAETDFIFAVLAEELGFAGVALLLGIFGLLLYRLLALLRRCRDDFGSFVILGTATLITIELFVNAGMTMGLLPIVGIPLPFVSAGGSSLVAHCLILGVIESIARYERAEGYRLAWVRAR